MYKTFKILRKESGSIWFLVNPLFLKIIQVKSKAFPKRKMGNWNPVVRVSTKKGNYFHKKVHILQNNSL